MILTDYYKFVKQPDQKSKSRIDCVSSSCSYNFFESLRDKVGNLFVYIGPNDYTKAGKKRKADFALTKVNHISSLYCPDVEEPYYYGDIKDTADAILVITEGFSITDGRIAEGAIVELFVARGKSASKMALYNLLTDGELKSEMASMREQAVK